MSYKVVTRPGLVRDKQSLAKIGADLVEAPLVTEEELIKLAADADAVVVGPVEPYTRKVIDAMKKCKVISRSGIGYNNIDVAAATDNGIPVAYVADASTAEVADHALTLALCLGRKIFKISKVVKEGGWKPGANVIPVVAPMFRFSTQTLGLAGLGRIGKSVCGKAKAFGMRVLVFDPFVTPDAIKALGAEPATLDKILAESDYISLHAPLTPETKHMFKLEQFQKMKKTAYIVNTSRGGLIDEASLVQALSQGVIAGAALDVTDPEPLSADSPLLKMDNVIITAHTSFYSETSLADLAKTSLQAALDGLAGKWPAQLANPEVKTRANRRIK